MSILPTQAQLSKKAGDLLLRAKAIKQEQYDAALKRAGVTGERFEEAIIDLGVLGEGELLKALSSAYGARFVSTEKLAKADVARATSSMIPRRVAEALLVFPVGFDPATQTLSVVAADPDNRELLHEVQITCGARGLKAYLARPAAIKAMIAKTYAGDANAFAVLDRQAHARVQGLAHVFGRTVLSEESFQVEPSTNTRERALGEREAAPAPEGEATARELLHALVGLLESGRPDLRGHSAAVAALARRVGEKLGLARDVVSAIVLGAYAHDLGKHGQYHLTALNCSEWEAPRALGQKTAGAPARLLEAAKLPEAALKSVSQMYERYDGKGFPAGLEGREIPVGARLLAVCDTYADLTQSTKNPYSKLLTPAEACAVLAAHQPTIFDPEIVLALKATVLTPEPRLARARGVKGSLREMGLPELVQVLSQGRKSGRLAIQRGDDQGEIHFAEGDVVNAFYGALRGEEAVYAMLRLEDGDFALDPAFRSAARTITASAEALLLEGMRRLDEGSS